jgi:hypothetical protein
MKIIYPNGAGVSVVHPTGELSLEETARKDVPAGVPYRFVSDLEVPPSESREGWAPDFSAPDGFGIGHESWFAERAQS